jgi:hypothetical protein
VSSTPPKLRGEELARLYAIALSDHVGLTVASLDATDRLLVDAELARAERRPGIRGLVLVATDAGRDRLEDEGA